MITDKPKRVFQEKATGRFFRIPPGEFILDKEHPISVDLADYNHLWFRENKIYREYELKEDCHSA